MVNHRAMEDENSNVSTADHLQAGDVGKVVAHKKSTNLLSQIDHNLYAIVPADIRNLFGYSHWQDIDNYKFKNQHENCGLSPQIKPLASV